MDGGLRITSDHPGGNVSVLGVGDEVVQVAQEIRDSTQWWFYWNFEAESDAERTVDFEFTNGEVVGPWGPAVSHDGRTWSWLGEDATRGHEQFTYEFDAGERVRFAFSLPYQVADFERYVASAPYLAVQTLTTSENGRDVPVVTLGNEAADADVLFTARHHACESIANYVLEGVLDRLQEDQATFLEDYRVHVIPFVDVDGVERGDQGKLRGPHDHNRDYVTGNALTDDVGPMYRATAAVMAYVDDLDLSAAVDVHCPGRWGGRSDGTFFVARPGHVESTDALSAALATATGDSAYHHDPENDERAEDLTWTQPRTPSCTGYTASRCSTLATTFEVPYFGTAGNVVTQTSSRELGSNLADALVAVT